MRRSPSRDRSWESEPSTGEEAAPPPGPASRHEDLVCLDITEAFAFFVNVTGDDRFLMDRAWPVLAAVSDWIASRAVQGPQRYEFPAMGVAERKVPSDNSMTESNPSRISRRPAGREGCCAKRSGVAAG
jgi:protein-glucosylgalactosylhydroxylysine glucosidase